MTNKIAPFPWRGVLLDESRHFFGKDFVKSLLDEMSALSYNKFHWHLSDDQGFRIALKKFPKLEEISSKRPYTFEGFLLGHPKKVNQSYSACYSEEDIRELLAYAANKGIEVVPEIDMPGHLSAVLAAYPQFTCLGQVFSVPGEFGILDHTLCLGNEEGMSFMEKLVDEVVALFHPHYFHLGFDEIKTKTMHDCPKCQSKMEELKIKTEKELIASFRQRMVQHLQSQGITPIVWDDEIDKAEEGVIVEAWKPRNTKRILSLISEGQKAIISPFFKTYASNPYCLMPLKKTTTFTPLLKGAKHPEAILGSEIAYWSEYYTTPEKFHFEFDDRAFALSLILQQKMPANYQEFKKLLSKKEQGLFNRGKTIPESILNPSFARAKTLWGYLYQSTDYEYQRYLKITANKKR
jgi:hexosaminidase